MAEASTLARPYAKAVYEFAVDHNSLDGWSNMLGTAAEAVGHEEMKEFLSSPRVTAEQQAETVIEVCGNKINEKAANLVRILAENKRLSLIPDVRRLFEELRAEAQRTVDVTVTTAYDLDDAVVEKLKETLGRKLDREVTLSSRIDQSLLGGVVIRAGDTVIDGSVKGKLAKLAQAINS